MVKVPSQLDGVLSEALLRSRSKPRGLKSELQGWREIEFDLPTMHDIEQMYRNCLLLTEDSPAGYLAEIAQEDEGFRGVREFEEDAQRYCGLTFFRSNVSFLLVFKMEQGKAVWLYYMGLACVPCSDDEQRKSQENILKQECSKLMWSFDGRLQEFYFRLRDGKIGKYGISMESDA